MLTEDGLQALQQRSWSGNVRGCKYSGRLAILTTDDRIDQVFIETVLRTHKKDIDLDNLVLKEDVFSMYKETAERIF